MARVLRTAIVASLMAAGCGDRTFDETSNSPTGLPPGSTTNNGSVSANVNGEQFVGRLATGATYVDGLFSFSANDGNTRQFEVSVRVPGPGTFESGSPNSPNVSLVEGSGPDARRWYLPSLPGAGSFSITFLSENAAVGYFSVHLFPDSATVAAGVTARRNVTAGAFNVNMSR